MSEKLDLRPTPRIAHYFRDVDLTSTSRPELIPADFPINCDSGDDQWSATFLLRIAVRLHHLWATYGKRNGERTIMGAQPAVCFSPFVLADLIAVRDGIPPENEAATWYALTFPTEVAQKGGILLLIEGADEHSGLADGAKLRLPDLFSDFGSINAGDSNCAVIDRAESSSGSSEWRWYYSGDYGRCVEEIGIDGLEDIGMEGMQKHPIPGLNLLQKELSGIGVVVPDMQVGRALQYDILSLIDRGLVSDKHFDHILVCDQLPASIDGLDEQERAAAFSRACLDFRSCMAVSALAADVSELDFSSRLMMLEASTSRKPVVEQGGCWLWFEDNTHPFVRALIKAGRVKPNQKGRYLASLVELDYGRDLCERQEMVTEFSEQLRERFGVRSSYFSVLNSQSPDDIPSFCGRWWGGGYFVTDVLAEEDE
ncbi:DUF4427 domain-containing protein [Pseudomonas sp. MWU16-30317]|uniref:DUF4427 domain-containing protein n=1 Tax=Pseudomonas sp. MWU16-30317 TaxID=2878095 RepID=UPI001CF97E9B|nr:DUF4427 domain-containing protein [Pseudomonas sp. MWU16-30317]